MIWFQCKQCGKTHGRPDAQAGTLVFCECGAGTRVPWASTAPEPEEAAVPEAEAVPEPPPAARVPAPPREEDPWAFPPARRREPPSRRQTDPSVCLNHPGSASGQTCVACGEAFCAACVTSLEGRTLCGPCKDFRVRVLERPPRVSTLALVAAIVSLLGGPFACLCGSFGVGQEASGQGTPAAAVVFSALGMLAPLTGLLLAALALREIETKPGVGGRALAMTGAVAGAAGALWTLTVAGLVVARQFRG
jgi:hypothetical protein